jgi:hypothetical protein
MHPVQILENVAGAVQQRFSLPQFKIRLNRWTGWAALGVFNGGWTRHRYPLEFFGQFL